MNTNPKFEFSFDDWLPRFSLDAKGPVHLSFRGPDHICLAELLRQEAGISAFATLNPWPTDIFVLGLGEGPSRYGTKIGGLPYLKQSDEWPISKSAGLPLTFVCQFRCDESIDLVGELPGDILLIFCEMGNRIFNNIEWHFEWRQIGIQEAELITKLPDRTDLLSLGEIPECYGVRVRYCDYVQADVAEALLHTLQKRSKYRSYIKEMFNESETDSMNFVRSWACQMCMLKIGGVPYWARPIEALAEKANIGRFLGLIPPVWDNLGIRYSWINREKDDSEGSLYWPPEGCIHIYITEDNNIVGRFASLTPW